MRLGWLFYLNGKGQNAIVHYQKAHSIKPKSLEPYLGLINVYLQKKTYVEAETMGLRALAKYPLDWQVRLKLVEVYLASKQYQKAQVHINKMAELYPTNFFILQKKLYISQMLGHDLESKSVAQEILLLSPANREAWETMTKSRLPSSN